MAKKMRQQFTNENGLDSLLRTIQKVAQAELGQLSPEDTIKAKQEGLAAVMDMTNTIGNSNMRTALQLQDDAIEQYHQIMEQQEADEQQVAAEVTPATTETTPTNNLPDTDPEPNF